MTPTFAPTSKGRTMFFTVALKDPSSDLLVREVETLRSIVRQTLKIRPFQIDAWVVLPNHMHCIWTLPAGNDDHTYRWLMIKGRFGNAFSRKERSHLIEKQENWQELVHYCWNDPVKHGLVAHPGEWPYSSWHRDNGEPAKAAS